MQSGMRAPLKGCEKINFARSDVSDIRSSHRFENAREVKYVSGVRPMIQTKSMLLLLI